MQGVRFMDDKLVCKERFKIHSCRLMRLSGQTCCSTRNNSKCTMRRRFQRLFYVRCYLHPGVSSQQYYLHPWWNICIRVGIANVAICTQVGIVNVAIYTLVHIVWQRQTPGCPQPTMLFAPGHTLDTLGHFRVYFKPNYDLFLNLSKQFCCLNLTKLRLKTKNKKKTENNKPTKSKNNKSKIAPHGIQTLVSESPVFEPFNHHNIVHL